MKRCRMSRFECCRRGWCCVIPFHHALRSRASVPFPCRSSVGAWAKQRCGLVWWETGLDTFWTLSFVTIPFDLCQHSTQRACWGISPSSSTFDPADMHSRDQRADLTCCQTSIRHASRWWVGVISCHQMCCVSHNHETALSKYVAFFTLMLQHSRLPPQQRLQPLRHHRPLA